MSTEQNKAVLRRWFEAQNTGDVNVMDKLADETMSADYVLHDPHLDNTTGDTVQLCRTQSGGREIFFIVRLHLRFTFLEKRALGYFSLRTPPSPINGRPFHTMHA